MRSFLRMTIVTCNSVYSGVPVSPAEWGWKDSLFPAAFQAAASAGCPCVPGRIIRTERHAYSVAVPLFDRSLYEAFGLQLEEGGPVSGIFEGVRVSGKFEYRSAGPADYPATGDWVLVEPRFSATNPRQATDLVIQTVLPRISSVSRTGAGATSDSQILAANVDTLFLVFALDGGRNFLERLLERSLIVARSGGVRPCVVLNKADLASPEDRAAASELARSASGSAEVLAVSAKTGEGIGELVRLVRPGETVGVLGKSGVGKSALVNALERIGFVQGSEPCAGPAAGAGSLFDSPALEGEVREDDRQGRHTTTSSRLYRLPSGILMIDSPGIRELKIWGSLDAVDETFPDIVALAGQCRFADCSHGLEAGCAVRAALESGSLDFARFRSWKNLEREQAYNERRSDEKARREHDQKWKNISKAQKKLRKDRS
jgi:ribosome biogenesis GTPase